MYRYFISYSHSCGFGCTFIEMNKRIYDMNDLNAIKENCETEKSKDVIILNFIEIPIENDG